MSATMVERAEGLWTVDHPLRVGPLPIGTRTTVVRLASGGLLVHSPGPLDDGLRARIEACGRVVALVAPNRLHHLFLAEHATAWPDAAVWLAPGLREKLPRLPSGEILDATAPAVWSGVLEQTVVGGAPRMGEVVFFHPASRTLLLADLVFNVRSVSSNVARLLMRVNGMFGHFGPSRVARMFFFRDRRSLRVSIDRILGWDFDRVVMSHGEIVESGGRGLFDEAFSFLRE